LKPFKTSQNVSLWASQSTCKAFPSCSGPPDVPNSPLCTPHPGTPGYPRTATPTPRGRGEKIRTPQNLTECLSGHSNPPRKSLLVLIISTLPTLAEKPSLFLPPTPFHTFLPLHQETYSDWSFLCLFAAAYQLLLSVFVDLMQGCIVHHVCQQG